MALPLGMNRMYLIALCLLAIGLILDIVGLATPEWSVADGIYFTFGLWETCSSVTCSKWADAPDEVKASEAFAVIGTLFGILALIFALLYIILPFVGKPESGRHSLIAMIASILAFICILICVIVWGTKFHDSVKELAHLGYSFGLTITAGIFMVIGGVLAQIGRPAILRTGETARLF